MREFYLDACEASFRWRDLEVFQLPIAQRLGVQTITRDKRNVSHHSNNRTQLRPSDLA